MLVEVADDDETDEGYLKKSGERLLKAAKNIESVVPTVVSIAQKIISLLILA